MTLTELRDYLNGFAGESEYDDIEVVVGGSDHSYQYARAQVTDAEYHKGHLSEFFDKANMSRGSKKVQVLAIE